VFSAYVFVSSCKAYLDKSVIFKIIYSKVRHDFCFQNLTCVFSFSDTYPVKRGALNFCWIDQWLNWPSRQIQLSNKVAVEFERMSYKCGKISVQTNKSKPIIWSIIVQCYFLNAKDDYKPFTNIEFLISLSLYERKLLGRVLTMKQVENGVLELNLAQ
jgi:hypothetical protein